MSTEIKKPKGSNKLIKFGISNNMRWKTVEIGICPAAALLKY